MLEVPDSYSLLKLTVAPCAESLNVYNTVLSVVFVINNNSANSTLSGIFTLDIPLLICVGKLSNPFWITSVIIPNNVVTLPLAAASPAFPNIVCCVTTGLCFVVCAVPGIM